MTHRGVEQLVARQAHNLEVACSSPASATHESGKFHYGICRFSHIKTLHAMRQEASEPIVSQWMTRQDIGHGYQNKLFCQRKQLVLPRKTSYFARGNKLNWKAKQLVLGNTQTPAGHLPLLHLIYIIMYTRAWGRTRPTWNTQVMPPQSMMTHGTMLKKLKILPSQPSCEKLFLLLPI